MKRTFVLAILLLSAAVNAKPTIEWTPVLQQIVETYRSDRVTMGGAGVGTGVQFVYHENTLAQIDANILWANGNAVSTRLALGFQRDGRWAPAVLSTLCSRGQRTETLSSTGERPAAPVLTMGLRAAPLRFAVSGGYISALEMGYAIGPDHGRHLQLTILAAGVSW